MLLGIGYTLLGILLSRLHGRGKFIIEIPKVYRNILWALPIGAITLIDTNIYQAVITFIFALLKCLAHGRGFRLHEPMEKDSTPEFIEKFIPNILPLFWYKMCIMGLTGIATVLGSVIVYGLINPWYGFIIFLGGLSKALSYWLGEKISKKYPTEIGEYLTGGFQYSSIILCHIWKL